MEWQEFCLENQRGTSHTLVPGDAVNSSTWSKEVCVHLRAFNSVSLSCLHLQKSQHRRMIGQLHPPLSRETHILGQVVHSGCRKRHTDTLS